MDKEFIDALQREIKILVRLVKLKYELCFLSSKDVSHKPDTKDTFDKNCREAINHVNNMIIQIAENISYLQVAHENENNSRNKAGTAPAESK